MALNSASMPSKIFVTSLNEALMSADDKKMDSNAAQLRETFSHTPMVDWTFESLTCHSSTPACDRVTTSPSRGA